MPDLPIQFHDMYAEMECVTHTVDGFDVRAAVVIIGTAWTGTMCWHCFRHNR